MWPQLEKIAPYLVCPSLLRATGYWGRHLGLTEPVLCLSEADGGGGLSWPQNDGVCAPTRTRPPARPVTYLLSPPRCLQSLVSPDGPRVWIPVTHLHFAT